MMCIHSAVFKYYLTVIIIYSACCAVKLFLCFCLLEHLHRVHPRLCLFTTYASFGVDRIRYFRLVRSEKLWFSILNYSASLNISVVRLYCATAQTRFGENLTCIHTTLQATVIDQMKNQKAYEQ